MGDMSNRRVVNPTFNKEDFSEADWNWLTSLSPSYDSPSPTETRPRGNTVSKTLRPKARPKELFSAGSMTNMLMDTDGNLYNEDGTPYTPDEEEDYAMNGMKTAPAKKVINNQPHQLSYITPREAQILKMLGGSGRMTNEGLPAYDFLGYGNDKKTSYTYNPNPKTFSDYVNNISHDFAVGLGGYNTDDPTYANRTKTTNNRTNFNVTDNTGSRNNSAAAAAPVAAAGADGATADTARTDELNKLIASAGTYNTSVDNFNNIFGNAVTDLSGNDLANTINKGSIYDLYDDPNTAENENLYSFYDQFSNTYDDLSGINLEAPDLTTEFDFTDDEKALFALDDAEDYGSITNVYGELVNTLDSLQSDRTAAVNNLTDTSNALYNDLDDATYMLSDYVNPDGTYDYRGMNAAQNAQNVIRQLSQTDRTLDSRLVDQTGVMGDATGLLEKYQPILSGIQGAYGAENKRIDDFGNSIYELIDGLGTDDASIASTDLASIKSKIDAMQKQAGRFDSDLGFDFSNELAELAGNESTIQGLMADRAAESSRVSNFQNQLSNSLYGYGQDASGYDITDLSQIESLQRKLNDLERSANQFSSPLGGVTTDVSGVRGTLDNLLAERAAEEGRINTFAQGIGTTEDQLRASLGGLNISNLDEMEELRRQIDASQLSAGRFSSLLDTSDAFRYPLEDLGLLEGDVNQLFTDRSNELDRISTAESDFARLAGSAERSAGTANRFSKAALDAIQDQITTGQRDISEFSSLLPYNFGEAGMDTTAVQDYIDAQTALDTSVSRRSSELDDISGNISGALRDFDTTELYQEDAFDQMLSDLSDAGAELSPYSGGRASELFSDLSGNRKRVNDQLDALYERRDEFEVDAQTMLENLTASDYGRDNYEEYQGLIDTLSDDIDLYSATQAGDERAGVRSELARRLGLVEADERAVQSRLAAEGSDYGFNDYSLYEADEDLGFYNFNDEEEEDEELLASSFLSNTRAA